MAHLVVTRDASQTVRAYLDGVERFAFDDRATADAVFSGTGGIARFFRDKGNEASAGFVDFVRLYDRVLTGAEATTLYNAGTPLRTFDAPTAPAPVPEPAALAILGFGFGLTGVAMRRRQVATAVA